MVKRAERVCLDCGERYMPTNNSGKRCKRCSVSRRRVKNIERQRRNRVLAVAPYPEEHWREVAAIYKSLPFAGRLVAIQERWKVPHTTAARWVREARRRGCIEQFSAEAKVYPWLLAEARWFAERWRDVAASPEDHEYTALVWENP